MSGPGEINREINLSDRPPPAYASSISPVNLPSDYLSNNIILRDSSIYETIRDSSIPVQTSFKPDKPEGVLDLYQHSLPLPVTIAEPNGYETPKSIIQPNIKPANGGQPSD